MDSASQALAARIREMRLRHFGPRGKAEFARRLEITPERYDAFERGAIPSPDLLVRMCACTGEDLQWLLTGVAGRGTLVISGAPDRYQKLLTRVADLVTVSPAKAKAVEAFLDLLERDAQVRPPPAALPPAEHAALVPVISADDLPPRLDDLRRLLREMRARLTDRGQLSAGRAVLVSRPSARTGAEGPARLATLADPRDSSGVHEFLAADVADVAAGDAFAVHVPDGGLSPLADAGELLIGDAATEPAPGAPCICRLCREPFLLCRVWLGESDGEFAFGRTSDGSEERVPRDAFCWAVEAQFRVRIAA